MTASVQLNQEGMYITAIFRGGLGQSLLKEIKVEVSSHDGTRNSGVIGNVVGNSAVIKGSGCGDQVIGTAYFKNGMSYVILNEKMQYIRGICPADYYTVVDPCDEIARLLSSNLIQSRRSQLKNMLPSRQMLISAG